MSHLHIWCFKINFCDPGVSKTKICCSCVSFILMMRKNVRSSGPCPHYKFYSRKIMKHFWQCDPWSFHFCVFLQSLWPVDWSLLDLAWVIVTRVLFSWVMSMDLYSTQLFCIIWTTTDLKYLIILVEHNKLIKNFR